MFDKENYIKIENIDLSDIRYRISTDDNFFNLAEAIKANGLIQPVILVKKETEYRIVSGYKRVLAVRENGNSEIYSKIVRRLNSNQKTHFLCSRLAIIDNSFIRELNNIELSRALSLLTESIDIKEISLNSIPFFNRKLNEKIIRDLLAVNSMGESVHSLILEKKLSVKNALKLNEFPTDVFQAFLAIFKNIRMGQNKQSEIIINFYETAHRDNIPLIDLITCKDVFNIINDSNPDENHKAKLLRDFILKKRFPELTRTFNDFRKSINQLKIEPEIKLTAPESFEYEDYSLSFQFKNHSDFNKKIEKLLSAAESDEFENIFK